MNMSGGILSKIVSIISQQCSPGSVPENALNELVRCVSSVSADYLRFDHKQVDRAVDKQRGDPTLKPSPVIYIPIYESPVVSIGIFYLRFPHSIIPLHDHPGIHGLVKVIYGSARVLQLSAERDPTVKDTTLFRVSEMQTLAAPHNSSVVLQVRPHKFNYHEITPYNEDGTDFPTGMAFFDVLFPPYDPPRGRDCNYYKVCPPGSIAGANPLATFLRRLPEPPSYDVFETELGPYYGPDV